MQIFRRITLVCSYVLTGIAVIIFLSGSIWAIPVEMAPLIIYIVVPGAIVSPFVWFIRKDTPARTNWYYLHSAVSIVAAILPIILFALMAPALSASDL